MPVTSPPRLRRYCANNAEAFKGEINQLGLLPVPPIPPTPTGRRRPPKG